MSPEQPYRALTEWLQVRTPAEIAANWWADIWLAWQQATLRPFIPAPEMGDLPPL